MSDGSQQGKVQLNTWVTPEFKEDLDAFLEEIGISRHVFLATALFALKTMRVNALASNTGEEAVKIYVVESGDYEQREIDLVADSVEAAVAEIKKVHGKPYIVEWREEEPRDGVHLLIGEFQSVPGYSTQHTARYYIEGYEVVSNTGDEPK